MTTESRYPHIAFIGGGNMARSIIGGLLADGWRDDRIGIADPDSAQRELLRTHFPGTRQFTDNRSAVQGSEVVVLAVKPQVVRQVAIDLSGVLSDRSALVISIAAGIRCQDLDRWLGGGHPVVRCMPNTPALVQSGATGAYANPEVGDGQRETAERIVRAVGLCFWFEDESKLEAVTAISGSGPAYFLMVMEALEAAGVSLGLDAEVSRLLTLQTAFGTAKLALESGEDAAALRRRVTSPGGTTERAVEQLERGEIRKVIGFAAQAAAKRVREIEEALGKEDQL
ncbi:MAG: pyrroline-5-carboxylate reductase [Gammaproteobacteria bacterium]|jgi:pyrroline-5-carboxylate reductase|nr:pyrroline-5-carboxylate reductase [Gammaproteobacteria bacterium]